MAHIHFDYSKVAPFVNEQELGYMQSQVTAAHNELREGTGAGSDFRGWIDLPTNYDKEEFARIKEAAKIQSDSEVLVVIGIGGSYLGARAAIDFLNHTFFNLLDSNTRKAPQIFFAGNSISSTYIADLIEVIGDRDFSVNVISNLEQLLNQRLRSVYSKSFLLRNMDKKKQTNVSTLQQIKQRCS